VCVLNRIGWKRWLKQSRRPFQIGGLPPQFNVKEILRLILKYEEAMVVEGLRDIPDEVCFPDRQYFICIAMRLFVSWPKTFRPSGKRMFKCHLDSVDCQFCFSKGFLGSCIIFMNLPFEHAGFKRLDAAGTAIVFFPSIMPGVLSSSVGGLQTRSQINLAFLRVLLLFLMC
jgi:hypothetical protein